MAAGRKRTVTPRDRSKAAKPYKVRTLVQPKIVLPETNVLQAAYDRMEWIFKEFEGPGVTVSCSGGKDSTVVLELALEVATRLDRLPLRVSFLDQECEFQATRDYMRYLADRPEIDMEWYQIPFRLFNATNHDDPWLVVWDPALAPGPEADMSDPEQARGRWARPKEVDSIHENTFGVDRFKDTLLAIAHRRPGQALLTGMRAEESNARRMTLVTDPRYKWVTWTSGGRGKGERPDAPTAYRFHPIHDWTFSDVWKYIHDRGLRYNTHYDAQYRYGVPVRDMRVSNYHHETALHALLMLQEIEPVTWERATERLEGIATFAKLKDGNVPTELPFMFSTWEDYLAHLLGTLVPDAEGREMFLRQRGRIMSVLPDCPPDLRDRVMCGQVISNDRYGTRVANWINAARVPELHEKWRAENAERAAREAARGALA